MIAVHQARVLRRRNLLLALIRVVQRSKEPCAKRGRTNHTMTECHVGTNKCMWYGRPEHSIATYLRRQKAVEKRVTRPVPPPCQGNIPSKPPTAGQGYIMSKKKVTVSSTVATGTLFLNSKPFCVLFDSGEIIHLYPFELHYN